MQAPMLFPNGTSSLGKFPYVEFGAGISNILKFIRVDCYWRGSYRDARYIVVEDPTGKPVKPVIDPATGQVVEDPTLRQKVLSRLKTPNFAVKIGAEFKF